VKSVAFFCARYVFTGVSLIEPTKKGAIMRLRILFTAFLFASIASFSRADGLIIPMDPHIRVRGSWAVQYHRVDIKVRDQVADVSIDQAFVNTGNAMIEVQYVFPIPPAAAIDSLTLLVDGREFKGKLLTKEEARRSYEAIVRTKRDPALLEYVNYGMYRTSAFPLLPGKQVRVVVHYTDLCKRDGDLVEVFYPLNTEKFSSRSINEVEIRTDILEKAPISAVYSPTHAVVIERPSPEHAIASYKITQDIPSADFRLMYQPTRSAFGATVLSYRPDEKEDGYFLLMVSPTPRAEKSYISPKDLVIALDRSGSMSGQKIEQAKSSLSFVLRNLNAGDRFNVIVYNDTVDALFEKLVTNDPEMVEKALGMIDRIHATGGTNIHDALTSALNSISSSGSDKRSRYILFLTDGLPTVGKTSESIILKDAAAANEQAKAHIFAMGIGYDVNVRLLDRLVGENRGVSSYVKEREALEPRISSLYGKLKNPVMTDLGLSFNGIRTKMTYPQSVPDLFEGDQIILVGRYDGSGSATFDVSGTYAGKHQAFHYTADFARTSDKFSYTFLEQLWAVRRIGFLLDQIQLNGRSTEVVDELVRLSRQYGIITPYTSFLADERTDLADFAVLNREASKSASALISNVSGAVGQINASNRAAMNAATVAPAASVPGMGAAQLGNSKLASYEANRTEHLVSVQNVANRALYKRGQQWIDSSIADRDISKLNASAKTIAQFSDEYFRLAAANSAADNQILATQQPGEELIVSIRGQIYRITSGQ
jgi:Ca-activated chloride channel family protein